MVQELTVECPHCHQVADIYLSTNACVIILNCPTCASPIMYFDHKIFVLTPHQLEAIKSKTRGSSMMNMLRRMVEPEEIPVEKSLPKNKMDMQAADQVKNYEHVSSDCNATSLRKIHIGSDDITNIKIELGMCRDVLEFIDKM